MNKTHSIFNIDIRNEFLIDECCKNESILNQNNQQKNYIPQNKNIKIISINNKNAFNEWDDNIMYYKKRF